jgi:hypothetical protein
LLIISVSNIYSQTRADLRFELLLSPGYSMSFIQNKNIIHSVSLGTELLIVNDKIRNPFLSKMLRGSVIGFDYQYSFVEDNNYIKFGYGIFPFFYEERPLLPFFPFLGIYGSYNINKNIFGIAPEIGINWFMLFTLSYRYNIMINENNRHELLFKVRIPLFLLFKVFKGAII